MLERMRLAEPAVDVVGGLLLARGGEDLLGRAVLDEVALEHEGGGVGNAGGLLHVVGDDNDRVVLAELGDEVLDRGGGLGVQRRAGLVHQQGRGVDGQGSRDAQALLLTAGESDGRLVQPVLDFVPQRGGAEGLLDDVVQVGLAEFVVQARAEGDVVVDGLGEGVWLLEDHADVSAELDDVVAGVEDVVAVDLDGALDAGRVDLVVHAVDPPQEGGFAAARWPDERGDFPRGHVEVKVDQGLEGAVPRIDATNPDGRSAGVRDAGRVVVGRAYRLLRC